MYLSFYMFYYTRPTNAHCAFVGHVQSKLYALVAKTPCSYLSQNNDFPNLVNKTWCASWCAEWNSTLHTRQSSTQNNKFQVSHTHSCFSCWWVHSRPKRVETDKYKYAKNKLCTNLFLFTRLHRDAWSTKHKKWLSYWSVKAFSLPLVTFMNIFLIKPRALSSKSVAVYQVINHPIIRSDTDNIVQFKDSVQIRRYWRMKYNDPNSMNVYQLHHNGT
jgi:hypothetical protein